MITNDYEPEELQFVLPEVVKDTFPLELTFGNAENEKEIIKAVNEHFNVMFPENELAMRYMDNFEKDEIRKKYCELVEKELPSAEAELLSAKEEAKRLKANAEEALNSVSRQINGRHKGKEAAANQDIPYSPERLLPFLFGNKRPCSAGQG